MVGSYGSFSLHFLMINNVEHIFYMLICPVTVPGMCHYIIVMINSGWTELFHRICARNVNALSCRHISVAKKVTFMSTPIIIALLKYALFKKRSPLFFSMPPFSSAGINFQNYIRKNPSPWRVDLLFWRRLWACFTVVLLLAGFIRGPF